jgi:hypothetical protein
MLRRYAAGSMDERPRARVAKYLVDLCQPGDPEEICLVAFLDMGNTTAANALDEEGDAGAEAIAIVSLSFTAAARGGMGTQWQGHTFVHCSAQRQHILWDSSGA